jgi:heat shock protein HtpX
MRCPNCKTHILRPTFTKQGVEIDCCEACGGIWLDKGEIFFFSKRSHVLAKELDAAIKEGKPTKKLSPKTEKPMVEIALFDNKLYIDFCPETEGLWFDEDELEKLQKISTKDLRINIDEGVMKEADLTFWKKTQQVREERPGKDKEELEITGEERKAEGRIGTLKPLPNLFVRSVSTLFLLYAMLGLVLIATVEFGLLSVNAALLTGILIAVFQFLLGPFIMDISLRFFYKMSWKEPTELPRFLSRFLKDVCREQNMKFPRVGILDDGAPQAFTYGHTPNNARVVISQGLIDLLDEKEVKAVVAHEIGHAKHWDMLIMTVAYIVPLVLYYIYRTLISVKLGERDRSAPARLAIAIGAYILYVIAQYIVLWFSRTREYYADRFSGNVTGEPDTLASALVKIAYGLAGQEKERKEAEETGSKRTERLEALGSLGIFDASTARSLAIASAYGGTSAAKMGEKINKETLKSAMKWDLWNPWARFYEIHSTHPLTANRLAYLSDQSLAQGREPFVTFDLKKPESYWDEFFVDLIYYFLPAIAVIFFALKFLVDRQISTIGMGIFAFGVTYLIKTFFSYKSDYFPLLDIESLLKKVKVSAVRPVPCKLKGKIIGKGVPGLIWSEDFVIQDKTGIMFLDYRQPLRIWEFFFGLLRGEHLQNKEAVVVGWYRRAPVPYVELKSITVDGKTRTCYVYHMKIGFGLVLLVIGFFVFLANFSL